MADSEKWFRQKTFQIRFEGAASTQVKRSYLPHFIEGVAAMQFLIKEIQMYVNDSRYCLIAKEFSLAFKDNNKNLLSSFRLCHNRVKANVEAHQRRIAENPAYINSEGYIVFEALIQKYYVADIEWLESDSARSLFAKVQQRIDEAQEKAAKMKRTEVDSILASSDRLQKKYDEILEEYRSLQEEFDRLDEHAQYLASECNRLASDNGSSIVGNVLSDFSPFTKFIMKMQINNAISEWSAKRLRS